MQIFYHFRYLNYCQILYFNATDLKLGSSTYFFLLFISGTVGRSRDQVLEEAYCDQLYVEKFADDRLLGLNFNSPNITFCLG